MKYLVASDIHGDAMMMKLIISKFKAIPCEKIILLGDYLGSNQKENDEILSIFELFKNDIIAIEGNCDRYFYDTFPLELRESFLTRLGDRFYLFTHGDNLDEYISNVLSLPNVYIVYGHTHRVSSYTSGQLHFINLGSISLPRGGSEKCYGILDENSFEIYSIDDKKIVSI